MLIILLFLAAALLAAYVFVRLSGAALWQGALFFLLVFLLRPRSKTEPLAAVVDFGDGITEVLPLDKDYDYLYEVGGYVVHLQVKDGAVAFQDSQCPDHVCEQFGWLSEEGAWAACVPAGVYVQLAPLSEAEAAS